MTCCCCPQQVCVPGPALAQVTINDINAVENVRLQQPQADKTICYRQDIHSIYCFGKERAPSTQVPNIHVLNIGQNSSVPYILLVLIPDRTALRHSLLLRPLHMLPSPFLSRILSKFT